MRILFISSSIPPATDMQTTRNMYLISSLIDDGHIVDVLTCGDYIAGQSSFDYVLDKVKIVRTEYPFIYRWHQCAQRVFKGTPFLKIHNVAVRYYAKPDLYRGWDNLVINRNPLEDINQYDCVISSSGSYTAHLIAHKLKRDAHFCWVAEYGDPWGLDEYGNIKKQYKRKEEKLLSNCDGLVFTTQNTIDAYKRNYNLNIPVCLVQCGYGSIVDDIETVGNNGRKTFTYTGIAYNSSRNLTPFLLSASKHEGMTVNIVGTYSESLKQSLSKYSNIFFSGRVPYFESLNIQAKSDVLVHIGNFGSLQVPGKSYIYLSTKKPILYIRQEKQADPTFELMNSFPGVVCCENEEEAITRGISHILNNYAILKHDSEIRTTMPQLEKYRWDVLGKRFSEFVSDCYKIKC